MTDLATAEINADQARSLTDRIKVAVEGTWHLITEAYQSRAWAALGYSSWDDYTTREFGTSRLRLPREERTEVVASLRDSGLSLRAISAVTGDSVTTVRRELAGVPNGTPAAAAPLLHALEDVAAEFGVDLGDDDEAADLEAEVASALSEPEPEPAATVTGTDGKTYTAASKRTPYRKPLPDVAKDKGFALRQSMDAVERLFDDNRYRGNEKQVALALRGHLLHVQDRVSALLDQLP